MFSKIPIANRGNILRGTVAALLIVIAASRANPESSAVPFVGCASDGQQGPIAPPHRKHKVAVQVRAEEARQLAYYQATFPPGVLAPRGWRCFGLLGSDGTVLLAAPRLTPLKSVPFADHPLQGPAVVAEVLFGGTSGRFGVADVLARIFPDQRPFVAKVMAGDESKSFHPVYHPFAADVLIRKGNHLVEFETPAHANGLGTTWWLRKGDLPARGVAIIEGTDTNLAMIRVRLPKRAKSRIDAIVRQFESETAKDRDDE